MKDEQLRKAFAKDVFINQERKLGARRRSDTVLVTTINHNKELQVINTSLLAI